MATSRRSRSSSTTPPTSSSAASPSTSHPGLRRPVQRAHRQRLQDRAALQRALRRRDDRAGTADLDAPRPGGSRPRVCRDPSPPHRLIHPQPPTQKPAFPEGRLSFFSQPHLPPHPVTTAKSGTDETDGNTVPKMVGATGFEPRRIACGGLSHQSASTTSVRTNTAPERRPCSESRLNSPPQRAAVAQSGSPSILNACRTRTSRSLRTSCLLYQDRLLPSPQRALSFGLSVLETEDGFIYEVFPDGRKQLVNRSNLGLRGTR